MQAVPTRPPPFRSAADAWFWAARVLQTAGAGGGAGGLAPCRVEEVLKCIDVLYRRRRIDLVHARVLRIWGGRGVAPNPGRNRERSDWRIWQEALERLDGPLRERGIVSGPVLAEAAD